MPQPAAARRVRVEVPLLLSVTLEGSADECSDTWNAFVEDAVETVERLARRYYLDEARGEAITATLPKECDVTDLAPRGAAPKGTGAAARVLAESRGRMREAGEAPPRAGASRHLRLLRPSTRRDQRSHRSVPVKP